MYAVMRAWRAYAITDALAVEVDLPIEQLEESRRVELDVLHIPLLRRSPPATEKLVV